VRIREKIPGLWVGRAEKCPGGDADFSGQAGGAEEKINGTMSYGRACKPAEQKPRNRLSSFSALHPMEKSVIL
jgi:hypothetical protein